MSDAAWSATAHMKRLVAQGLVPGVEGLIVASGHFRSGILLAPITGRVVADMLTEGKVDPLIVPFLPNEG